MHRNHRLPAVALSVTSFLLAGCSSRNDSAKTVPPMSTSPQTAIAHAEPSSADPQMKAVLDALTSLNPKPIQTLPAVEARKQSSPTDAVMKLMKDRGMPTTPEPVGNVENRTVPGMKDGPAVPVRIYTPKGDGPFPVLVYFHGGGWVIATLDTYDPSCRALTNMANCVVVSVDYRQAPEHKFPAAHEDSYAAFQWVMKHAGEIKGDPKHVAVGGESAGGNLAAAVCLMAKERGGMLPVHQLLVYPIANYGFDTPSYQANAEAKPLNKVMMQWFFEQYLTTPADGQSKLISLVRASESDLKGLPPATVITAQIDPLMSEGQMYADKLKGQSVDVAYRNFDGVTHEFFGMGAVVDQAKRAEQFAADRLKSAFAK